MNLLKIIIIVVGISWPSFSQNINQFDANGNRHGKWQKKYEGTQVLRYEGQFAHGKETGTFKFYKNNNGKASLAATKVFKTDSEQVFVTFFDDNEKPISEGAMIGKINIGEWKYYQNSSKSILTLENYNDKGLLHGKQVIYYNNGQIAEQKYYTEGKLEGEAKWFSENGNVLKVFNYSNGQLHGLSKYFDAKGNLLVEGQYKNDKKDGVWRHYENDSLIKEENFTYKPKYIKVNGKYKKAP